MRAKIAEGVGKFSYEADHKQLQKALDELEKMAKPPQARAEKTAVAAEQLVHSAPKGPLLSPVKFLCREIVALSADIDKGLTELLKRYKDVAAAADQLKKEAEELRKKSLAGTTKEVLSVAKHFQFHKEVHAGLSTIGVVISWPWWPNA